MVHSGDYTKTQSLRQVPTQKVFGPTESFRLSHKLRHVRPFTEPSQYKSRQREIITPAPTSADFHIDDISLAKLGGPLVAFVVLPWLLGLHTLVLWFHQATRPSPFRSCPVMSLHAYFNIPIACGYFEHLRKWPMCWDMNMESIFTGVRSVHFHEPDKVIYKSIPTCFDPNPVFNPMIPHTLEIWCWTEDSCRTLGAQQCHAHSQLSFETTTVCEVHLSHPIPSSSWTSCPSELVLHRCSDWHPRFFKQHFWAAGALLRLRGLQLEKPQTSQNPSPYGLHIYTAWLDASSKKKICVSQLGFDEREVFQIARHWSWAATKLRGPATLCGCDFSSPELHKETSGIAERAWNFCWNSL